MTSEALSKKVATKMSSAEVLEGSYYVRPHHVLRDPSEPPNHWSDQGIETIVGCPGLVC